MHRFLTAVTVVVSFVILGGFYWFVGEEQQPVYVILLFTLAAVPVFIQMVILGEVSRLGSMTAFTICASSLVLGLSWAIYTLWIDSGAARREALGWLLAFLQHFDLFWCFVLVAFTLHMTALVLKGLRSSEGPAASGFSGSHDTASDEPGRRRGWQWAINLFNHRDIKAEIQQHPVFSMIILFAVLLHVTYTLAFALAFHDQRVMGLFVTPLDEARSVGEFVLENCQLDITANGSTTERLRQIAEGSPEDRMVRIVVEGVIDSVDYPMDGTSEPQWRFEADCVEDVIQELADQVGLASLPQVEWLFRTSVRRQPNASSSSLEGNRIPFSLLRVTAIYGKDQGARPELLDYIYFMVYTIVTTGYGDLVPATPFAKLICTLANIFEQFFSVVFFGVFVSFIGGLGIESTQG